MRDGSDCLIREESGPWGWSLTPVLLLPNIGPTSAAIESLIGQLAARVGQYSPPGGEDGTGYATFENFPRVSSCAAPNLRDSLCRRTLAILDGSGPVQRAAAALYRSKTAQLESSRS